MKFTEACKLLDDEHLVTNQKNLTPHDFEQLKKIANEYINQLKDSNKKFQLTQYQNALATIELNEQFQKQYNEIKGKTLHQIEADIEPDHSVSLYLVKPTGRNKIFNAVKNANGIMELTLDPRASANLSDDEIAEAAVAFALAHKATGISVVTPNQQQLSPLEEKIKVLCKEKGLGFFRQTPEEYKRMLTLSGAALKEYTTQKIKDEANFDNTELQRPAFNPTLKPMTNTGRDS